MSDKDKERQTDVSHKDRGAVYSTPDVDRQTDVSDKDKDRQTEVSDKNKERQTDVSHKDRGAVYSTSDSACLADGEGDMDDGRDGRKTPNAKSYVIDRRQTEGEGGMRE